MRLSIESALRKATQDPRAWADVGLVTEVAEHATWGIEVMVELPDGGEAACRPAWAGLRGARGALCAFAKGEEVIVLFPGGHRNAAIVLDMRPANDGQGVGPTFDNDDDTRQRFGREDVAHHLAEGAVTPESVVVAPFLDDLSTHLDNLITIGNTANASATASNATTVTGTANLMTGAVAGSGVINANTVATINTLRDLLIDLGTTAQALKTLVDKSRNRVDGRAGYPHASDLLRAGNTATR